jgi:hypothetical protein
VRGGGPLVGAVRAGSYAPGGVVAGGAVAGGPVAGGASAEGRAGAAEGTVAFSAGRAGSRNEANTGGLRAENALCVEVHEMVVVEEGYCGS